MVQALIDVDKKTNTVLNIVKAKYDLNDKSAAIEKLAEEYAEQILEPGLRPEFVEKIKGIEKKGRFVKVKKVEDLWK